MSRRIQNVPATRALRRIDSTSAASARMQVIDEIERWRAVAIPERSTPLEAEDLVRLLRDCMSALELDAAIAAGVSVNTVHYYRRKDIIDPPSGRTAAARYDIHHLWQVAGARLAGHLALATLAEARDAIRGADEHAALSFLASRVVDARARVAAREPLALTRTLSPAATSAAIRPLPVVAESTTQSAPIDATVLPLPGGAWCVVPASHAARRSNSAAEELANALVEALRSIQTS